MGVRKGRWLWGLLLCFCAGLSLAQTRIDSARLWRSPEGTRLVFDLSRTVEHKIFRLDNPERLVIDIDNSRLKDGALRLELKGSPIERIRTAARNQQDLRVVLDLKRAVTPRSFVLKPNQQYGDRLVIDLLDQQQEAPVATPSAQRSNDVIVAIDAGHGGEDPGAIGHGGVREKDVVLAIAKELKALLEKEPGFKPVLIRSGDYYVSLRGRTKLARKHQADLFVSIHADAFKDKRARGSSVFALSHRGASSEAARWLAQKENSADLIGGVGAVTLDDKDEMLAGVLLDLSMTATLQASLAVGDQVLGAMGAINKLHKSRVEQAAFVVLKSPDIPSILVETGFITNPDEARKLGSRSYQKQMANKIFQGVRGHFHKLPPPGTWLANRKSAKPARHVVQRGDTLSGIASRYNVALSQLRSHNRIQNDRIRVDQVLMIP